jgi:hypothetical protein
MRHLDEAPQFDAGSQIVQLMQAIESCRSPPAIDDQLTQLYLRFTDLTLVAPCEDLNALALKIREARAETVKRLQRWRTVAVLVAFMRANAGHPLANSGISIVSRHFPSNHDPLGLNRPENLF